MNYAKLPYLIVHACWSRLWNSVQVGAPAAALSPSRPVGEGGPPPQRLIGDPSEQLGALRNGPPSCPVGGVALRGPQ
eukprot:3430563-Alexandrium_andersonii.AAC.1